MLKSVDLENQLKKVRRVQHSADFSNILSIYFLSNSVLIKRFDCYLFIILTLYTSTRQVSARPPRSPPPTHARRVAMCRLEACVIEAAGDYNRALVRHSRRVSERADRSVPAHLAAIARHSSSAATTAGRSATTKSCGTTTRRRRLCARCRRRRRPCAS